MNDFFAWIIGIAAMFFAIFIPFAYVYSIRESMKADRKSTRVSYRRGWTNKPWK